MMWSNVCLLYFESMMVKWLEIELQQKPKNVTVAEDKNNYQ